MKYKYFSHNGNLLPIEKATIPVSNIEYSYGFGVYESLRVRNNIVYFEKQYIKRLLNSASILGISHLFITGKISEFISNLINQEKPDTCNIKMLLIGGRTAEESQLFIILLNPFFPDRKLYTSGVSTITYKFQRMFPNAKTLNMLGSYMAYRKAKENSCYDALLVDENKNIIEGTRTNFLVIKDKKIFTQPEEQILEGITREIVLHIAKKKGYQIVEKNVSIEALSDFDSAFLTSTSSKIIPIKKIDKFVFPEISENLKALMKNYDDFLEHSNGVFNP